jgi:hypothetical protein
MRLAAQAQTTWDAGGGIADTSWGNNLNWDNDSLPAYDGTDALTVLLSYTDARRNVVLGADRSVGTRSPTRPTPAPLDPRQAS